MMLKLAALTILLVVSTVDCTKNCNCCPPSWKPMGKRCVRLFHQSLKTFFEAENACYAYKVNDCSGNVLSEGHLVSIHSQTEQDFLVKIVKETLTVKSSWDPQVYTGMLVGATNSRQTVQWTDGSAVDFTSWFPGEPNNAPHSKGAIAAGDHSKGKWADVYSDSPLSYICELPCLEYQLS